MAWRGPALCGSVWSGCLGGVGRGKPWSSGARQGKAFFTPSSRRHRTMIAFQPSALA